MQRKVKLGKDDGHRGGDDLALCLIKTEMGIAKQGERGGACESKNVGAGKGAAEGPGGSL